MDDPLQQSSPPDPTTTAFPEPVADESLPPKSTRYKRLLRTPIPSLTSNAALSQRTSPRSPALGREGLLIVKFESEWRNPLCPVEQWYQNQARYSQGTNSTTRSSAIILCRALDAPFYHEYLIIPLADGSLYRVERTGIGSNADAVRPSGCISRDLVEWFPSSEKHEMSPCHKTSVVVTEIELPSSFDILDLLAVCYSIQQHPHARNYSLHRFNCYFFCCTIIAIQARRIISWENVITQDQWNNFVGIATDYVLNLARIPLTPEAKRYSILRFCAILGPEHTMTTQSLIREMRNMFNDPQLVGAVKGLLTETLAPYPQTVDHARPEEQPAPKIGTATVETVDNVPDATPSHLLTDIADKLVPGLFGPPTITNLLNVDAIRKLLLYKERKMSACLAHILNISPHVNMKKKILLRSELIISSRLIWLWPEPGTNRLNDGLAFDFSQVTGRFALACRYTSEGLVLMPFPYDLLLSPLTNVLRAVGGSETVSTPALMSPKVFIAEQNNMTANKVLDILTSWGLCYLNEVATVYRMLEAHGGRAFWRYPSRKIVCDAMMEALKAQASAPGKSFVLRRQGKTDTIDIFILQDLISQRIGTYALQVDGIGIGSFRGICYDVQGAIAEIWRTMPEGFGAAHT
ncbi:hypothetical protein FRC09_020996 [Ceratobasidium sp. 395]|nr:hypothetical protein FRC09_020996 [Ceratobasidium sp. 395]